MPMRSSRCWDGASAAPIGASAVARAAAGVLSVLCCWLAPAAGQPEVRAAETPTALQLLERMDAVLPREGTVVWSGHERVSDLGFHRYRKIPGTGYPTGIGAPPSPPEVRFTDTISFRPGYYQRRSQAPWAARRLWTQLGPWAFWRADCSLLDVFTPGVELAGGGGIVSLAPHAARLPHEILFQPRRIRDWMDHRTLKLQKMKRHWLVSCSSPSYPAPFESTYTNSVELLFAHDRSTGDLPEFVRLTGPWGTVGGKLLDFSRDAAGRFLPRRIDYSREVGGMGHSQGCMRLDTISSRFSDGPTPPAISIPILEGRLQPTLEERMKLNEAPPPLWLVHARRDWRAGYLSLPLAGRVPIPRNLPELGAMMAVLCLALWQRARISRGRTGRRRRTRSSA